MSKSGGEELAVIPPRVLICKKCGYKNPKGKIIGWSINVGKKIAYCKNCH